MMLQTRPITVRFVGTAFLAAILCSGCISAPPTPADDPGGPGVNATGGAGGNSGGSAVGGDPDSGGTADGGGDGNPTGGAGGSTGSGDAGSVGDGGGNADGGSTDSGTGSTGSTTGQASASFQNGKNGYESAKSVDISTLGAGSWNGYNGTTFVDDVDWCIGDLPGQGYDISPLMRFEDLNVPAGATVVSATLTCTFQTYYSDQKVVGHYLAVSWSTDPGTDGNGVGWLKRDADQNWTVPGARGDGSDVHAGKSFEFSGFSGMGWETKTTDLDPAVVQQWIDDPASNFGIVLTVDTLDRHVGIRQPQNASADERPILTITYALAQ